MLASAVAFVVMAVLAKWLGDTTSVATLIFWRSLAGLLAVLPFAAFAGRGVWRTPRPGRLMVRSLWGTIGFFAGFYALVHLPLADSQALSFSRTLFLTVLAVVLLRERVTWRRWTAVAIGFVGILVMTRPQAGLSVAALSALVSALAFALALATVKDLTADHSPLTLVLYGNLITTLAGLPALWLDPVLPAPGTIAVLLAMGLAGVAAQSAYVRALSVGEASLMGLVDYVRLPLVALAGWLVFRETPDIWTVAGAVLVIAATGWITLREAKGASPQPGTGPAADKPSPPASSKACPPQ